MTSKLGGPHQHDNSMSPTILDIERLDSIIRMYKPGMSKKVTFSYCFYLLIVLSTLPQYFILFRWVATNL